MLLFQIGASIHILHVYVINARCVNYIVHKTHVKHETRDILYFTFEITSESWLKNFINTESEMTWFSIAQMNNTVGLALCLYQRIFGDFRYYLLEKANTTVNSLVNKTNGDECNNNRSKIQ